MLSELLLALVLVTLMAGKRRKRRYNANFGVIRVQNQLALLTLADQTVLKITLAAVTQECYAISAHLLWGFRGGTSANGPVMLGMAHGDYSVTEIKECLEADTTSQGTKIEQEQSRRQIRDVGYVPDLVQTNQRFNQGNIKKTKLGFNIEDGQSIDGFVYNLFGAPLDTGAILEVTGKIFVRWK